MFHLIKINRVVKLFIALSVLLSASLGAAQESSSQEGDKTVGETNSTNAALASVTGAASGFRFQGAITHTPRSRDDQEVTTDVFARVDYTINKKHRVRVQQGFTKLYTKYNSQYEFQAGDMGLAHYYKISAKPAGINMQWRTGLAVPISNNSQRKDLFTRVTGSLITLKTFLKKKLMAFAVPYARYHLYEYKTSKSGSLLPLYTLGLSLSGVYFITSDLSFSVAGNYNFEGVSSSQFDLDQSRISKQLNRGIYRFDLDLSYQITTEFSASLSYFQGASYMQRGRYELVFYDDQESRYSVGLSYIF